MKKIIIFSLLYFCITANFYSQNKNETTIETKLDMIVNDIVSTKVKLNQFIDSRNIIPESYNQSKYDLNISLYLNYDDFVEFDKLIESWGYTLIKNTIAKNFQEEIQNIEKEIEILENENSRYKSLAQDSIWVTKNKSFEYWEKIITLEKEIAKQNLQKEDFQKKHKKYLYQLNFIEEENSVKEYSSSWINMPGIEYSLLFTEQPESGITSDKMQGFALKYMFNYGKTYALLGLYKNIESHITTEIDETYIFAFGQDFYSKRMGRGQRKFFNLYTSFNVGVYVSTSQTESIKSWFTNPFLGLEVFKNKYFLIDNKVGYFLPYKNNRTQRGLLYNASFNFVF